MAPRAHTQRACSVRQCPRITQPLRASLRFAGRFASADQQLGIRAAATVPGRGIAARARRAPIGPTLGARARGFRRNRRARIGAMFCGRLRDSSVSGAAAGANGRRAAGREAEAKVQNQARKLHADAAAGEGRGNSRLHLHPRRHLPRSGHALRASGHHHWAALASCASDECTRSGAWRHAESKASAGKIGARSTCCGASVSSLDECPARARPR